MNILDIHILKHDPSTTPDWFDACLTSAQQAEQLGATITVIGNPGTHIGQARATAYRSSQAKYVAALDSDDILIAEAIPPMLEALDADPNLCGVYSDRQQIDAQGQILFDLKRQRWSAVNQLTRPDYPHQLAIFRRAAITPHLPALQDYPIYSEFVLAGMATEFGPWQHVPTIAYKRREKEYYINHRRPIPTAIRKRAKALVQPILLRRLREQAA